LTVRRAFSRGLSLQAAYNYGKAITDIATPQDAYDRRSERALAPYDARHKLSVVGLWDMPLLKGKGWITNAFGAWQLSGFMVLQSGNPITITRGGSYPTGDFNADNTAGDRPNAPATELKKSGWTKPELLNGVFQVADFPRPAPATNGNLGRSTYTGAGFAELDLSLAKRFTLTERLSAQLRLESFNALNRVNLTDPVTDLNNAAFGRATGAYTPRLFQLGLRFQF
jgi:hypothetical protein